MKNYKVNYMDEQGRRYSTSIPANTPAEAWDRLYDTGFFDGRRLTRVEIELDGEASEAQVEEYQRQLSAMNELLQCK